MTAAVRQRCFLTLARLLSLAVVAASVSSAQNEPQATNANVGKHEDRIRHLISMYAKAADKADQTLASRVWCDSADDSLINPVGRWHGAQEIIGFYRHEMGDTYSSRKLKIADISIRAYTTSVWAEFSWNFEATRKKDGSAVSFHGLETQIYQKNGDSWCLVHVHYSALPAQQERATSSAGDEDDAQAEIDGFNHKFEALHLRMDHAAVLAMWADDGVDLMPGENPLVGKKAITQWVQDIRSRMAGHKVTKEELQFHDIHVFGNWATEWATENQAIQMPDGKPPVEGYGKIALVLNREPSGEWKIKQEMWNDAPRPQIH